MDKERVITKSINWLFYGVFFSLFHLIIGALIYIFMGVNIVNRSIYQGSLLLFSAILVVTSHNFFKEYIKFEEGKLLPVMINIGAILFAGFSFSIYIINIMCVEIINKAVESNILELLQINSLPSFEIVLKFSISSCIFSIGYGLCLVYLKERG